ncbi:DUF2175 domain-containing protein [Caldivirga sp.]|uniref:DUF2175 domain-containing protein n=1 Tax=Caldivirga sp. TaxID=2080243 RepID=UPI0025C1301B|nr:DUF2175 domain-containing protein [Caldivirga sp.]
MSIKQAQGRTWKCYFCGSEIVEGQRFTFTSRGPIHWGCFRVEVANAFNNRIPEDIEVLLELVDYLNEGIVKIKEGEYRVNGDLQQSLINRRKMLEAEAAKLMKELSTLAQSKYNVAI